MPDPPVRSEDHAACKSKKAHQGAPLRLPFQERLHACRVEGAEHRLGLGEHPGTDHHASPRGAIGEDLFQLGAKIFGLAPGLKGRGTGRRGAHHTRPGIGEAAEMQFGEVVPADHGLANGPSYFANRSVQTGAGPACRGIEREEGMRAA
jgi:hypothetical protein